MTTNTQPQTQQSGGDELENILGNLATELLEYDQRMTEAGAPPLRFVHKYIASARRQLQARERAAELRGRIDELVRAKRQGYITGPLMYKVDRRLEQLQPQAGEGGEV